MDKELGLILRQLREDRGRSVEERSGRPPADLDDPGLIAAQRSMTVEERLAAGLDLCEFPADFAGAARR